jgi:hypothetical protein
MLRLICRRIRFLQLSWLILVNFWFFSVAVAARAALPVMQYQEAIPAFKYRSPMLAGSAYC